MLMDAVLESLLADSDNYRIEVQCPYCKRIGILMYQYNRGIFKTSKSPIVRHYEKGDGSSRYCSIKPHANANDFRILAKMPKRGRDMYRIEAENLMYMVDSGHMNQCSPDVIVTELSERLRWYTETVQKASLGIAVKSKKYTIPKV
jgi:hypothetical protein